MVQRNLTHFLFFGLFFCYSCGNNAERNGGSFVKENPFVKLGPDESRLKITAENYSFFPDSIIVTRNKLLKIFLVNKSDNYHNIRFVLPSGEVELPKAVAPGHQDSLILSVPDQEGVFSFYCPVASHDKKGMEGSLVVLNVD